MSSQRLNGFVAYVYAFDLAYELSRRPILTCLGQPVAQFVVDPTKRAPRQHVLYKPQMIRLPAVERHGPGGPVTIERVVKILPVGAISITVRIPFHAATLNNLVSYHDLRFNDGTYLYDEVRDIAEQVRRELREYSIRPVEHLGDEEAYTVFCINGPLKSPDESPLSAENWLRDSRREISALLTEETDPHTLSNQEAEESSGKYLSYYENDLVVMDWDAALIVDEPKNFEEVLYVMELANLQLAELEAYDRLLDIAVERSYRDLGARRIRNIRTLGIQRELREIRIDMARLSDELSNITKFLGDWHLARIYQVLSGRFHLGDWHRTIDDKLKTLDDLYQILRADQMNRWMLILELTIVLLFVLDIVKSFIGK